MATPTVAPPTPGSYTFSTPLAVSAGSDPRVSLTFSSPHVKGATPHSVGVASAVTSPPSANQREAKLLELQSSALSLKQRIENEKRKLELLSSPKPLTSSSLINRSHSCESSTQTNPLTHHTLPLTHHTLPLTHQPHPPTTSISHVAMTTATVPALGGLPWQQKGGDQLSVINIYTRRETEGKEKEEETRELTGGSEEELRDDTEEETEEESKEEEEEVKDNSKDDEISCTVLSPVLTSPVPPPITNDVSPITPPGSSSFTDSFVTPPTTTLPVPLIQVIRYYYYL